LKPQPDNIANANRAVMPAKPPAISWPTDEQRKAAFEAYTLAVGKVAHAWNYLHEKLGQLFVVISSMGDRRVALAVWYSTDNDRAQRKMLRAAVQAADAKHWQMPKRKEDLVWLLNCVDELAEARNNAIHAPCSLYIGGGTDGSPEMGAAFFHGHPRARKLQGKRLFEEFDWCERYAEALSEYTQKVETSMAFADCYPWPERPSIPHRQAR
jgi:hypothetical protein